MAEVPHRLWLDAQAVQGPFAERGIARYVTSVVLALHEAGAPIAAVGLNPAWPAPPAAHHALASVPGLTWTTAATFRAALTDGPLTYVSLSAFEGLRPVQACWPPFVLDSGCPIAAVVYDAIPFHDRTYLDQREARLFHAGRRALLRSVDLLLAISEDARRELVSVFDVPPERVATIGSGVGSAFTPSPDAAAPRAVLARHLPALRLPFLLDVAGWVERKNVEGLLAAYALLPGELAAEHTLVLAGGAPAEVADRWRAEAVRLGIPAERLVLTSSVTDEVLVALYQAAALMVYPSRSEGFGLPIAEAAACGCPTICSNTSAMPEVIGWPPATFAPDDPAAMAALIERGLTDTSFRTELVERGSAAAERHTRAAVARRLMASVAGIEPTRPTRQPPLRVAIVALAGSDLLEARLRIDLPPGTLIDCFVDRGPDAERTPRADHVRTFPISAFGRTFTPAGYDHILYDIGPTPAHAQVLRLALDHPGTVWLPEPELAAVYLELAGGGDERVTEPERRSAMLALLESLYGKDEHRLPWPARHEALLDSAALRALGLRCTAGLLAAGNELVVEDRSDVAAVVIDAGPLVSRRSSNGAAPSVRVLDERGLAGILTRASVGRGGR